MFLIAAVVLFAVYVINVVLGSFGAPTFLDDLGEMVLLLIAAVVFTVAILRRETEDAKKSVPSEIAAAAANKARKPSD